MGISGGFCAINSKNLKVVFNKELETLDKADVTVTSKATGEKQYVKAVTLAEDKKSATVEFYDALKNKTTYTVAVKSGDETVSKDFDFVSGEPVKVEVENLVVPSDTPTVLKYKVLDENGLDITADVKDKTVFKTTAGSVDADGKITLASTDSPAFVVVEVTKADGTVLKSDRFTVEAQVREATALAAFTVDQGTPDWESKDFKSNNLISKDGTNYSLYINVKDQFGEVLPLTLGDVEFESLSKDILLVDRITGDLTPLKAGIADVRIKVGKVNTIVSVNVGDEAKVNQLSFDKTELNVSEKVTTAQTVKVTLKDQFDREFKAPASGYEVKATVKSGADFIELVGATDGTVKNIITSGNSETTFSVKAKKAGTAVIEISSVADSNVKGTVTVNVTAAGTVADFAVEGFKAELDKNTDSSNKNKTMNLQVYPVDANGVKTGDELTTAKLTVKDKNGNPVTGYNGILTSDSKDIDAADFTTGETYTAIVSVGDLDVFTQTFTVVDSTPKPSVELTSGSLTDGDADLDLFDDLAAKLKVSGKGFEDASVAAVSFKSDNRSVVASADDVASIAILGEGNATLVLTSVTVDKDGDPSTDTDRVEVDFSEIISVSVDFEDLAQVLPEENVVAHTVVDLDKNEVTGTYENGVYTISHDFTKLTEEQGGAPSVAKWIGVYIEGPENATKVAKLTIKGTNPKSFENVEFETETGYEDGFFYFFPANKNGNENDLTIAWADDDGNIVKVEKLKVKYVNTASE